MTRQEIITEVKKYFKLNELVCPHVYDLFGQTAWQFLSTQLLHTILVLRTEIFKLPMIVNNGSFTQRGLRCNMCDLVKSKTDKGKVYMSAHCLGEAIDFDVQGVRAIDARNLITENKDKLPYNIRVERDVNWVHVDMYDKDTKLYLFTA